MNLPSCTDCTHSPKCLNYYEVEELVYQVKDKIRKSIELTGYCPYCKSKFDKLLKVHMVDCYVETIQENG